MQRQHLGTYMCSVYQLKLIITISNLIAQQVSILTYVLYNKIISIGTLGGTLIQKTTTYQLESKDQNAYSWYYKKMYLARCEDLKQTKAEGNFQNPNIPYWKDFAVFYTF